MLLELADYYPLLFLAPFLLLWAAVLPEGSLVDGAALGTWGGAAVGAYYLHPLDAVLFTTWAVLVFFPLLGLSPEAGAVASAFLAFCAAFQHANIRTPRWLGYIVQRPESHGIHHGRGVHRHNYSDLPLWDMAFGTFRNPVARETPVSAGFYHGGSARLAAMLAFREP